MPEGWREYYQAHALILRRRIIGIISIIILRMGARLPGHTKHLHHGSVINNERRLTPDHTDSWTMTACKAKEASALLLSTPSGKRLYSARARRARDRPQSKEAVEVYLSHDMLPKVKKGAEEDTSRSA